MPQPQNENIIVAIEIASSKIRGAAGYKTPDGTLHLLALEETDAKNAIRKGNILNIDKTITCLKQIKEQIENKIDKKITQAFIGIAGQGLRSRKNTICRQFPQKTIITQDIIDNMMEENKKTTYTGAEILTVETQEYHTGIDTTTDPVGILANKIEATYLNITAKEEIKTYLNQCLEEAGIKNASINVSPLILAQTCLTPTERRTGCALIDMGYGTTTVTIWKNNLLRRLTVIPLGGENITIDLREEQLEEDEAENIKLKYASAFPEGEENNEPTRNISTIDNHTIEEEHINEMTQAREEEILANVAEQIRKSQWGEKLNGGIILTGGASNIKNINKATKNRLHPTKTRTLRTPPFAITSSMQETLTKDSSKNTILSLVFHNNRNCTEPKNKTNSMAEGEKDIFEKKEKKENFEKQKKQKNGWWTKMKQRLVDLSESVTEE